MPGVRQQGGGSVAIDAGRDGARVGGRGGTRSTVETVVDAQDGRAEDRGG